MTNKITNLLAAIAVIGSTATFAAEEAKPAKGGEGTLMVQDKDYALKYAVAYETTMDEVEKIVVVLSGQAISSEKLKEARAEEKDGHDASFNRPFLKLQFSKAGELSGFSAAAGISFMSKGASGVKAELKLQDGRVIGKASLPNETSGSFHSGFDVHFDAPLFAAGATLPATKKAGPASNVKPTVTGTFKGNGKEAKIAYVSAQWREPFGDKPSMVLVFTEKDHSKDKKPDFNASFGKFGSALVISLHEDGSIFGCQVTHSAISKQGFSSTGEIHTDDYKFEEGQVEGVLATGGPLDIFGETWEVNLKFVAPLGEIPKEFQPADSKKKKDESESEEADDNPPKSSKQSKKSAAQPAVAGLKAKDLALTKDATDTEYKTLVEHVTFKSKGKVKAVATELSANLKAQGWTSDGSDLITPASSILKRKRGDATLTIFVKPEGDGTEVKMFTTGLSWDES